MSSKWVKLNVGGQLFHTTLTTLLTWPDSLLAKMFESESGFAPPYSENGVYFLDSNPKYFAVILDWLRYGEIMVDADINPRNVAKVADYFGLEKLVRDIREMGAVVLVSDEDKCTSKCGDCLGLFLKQEDNSYRQAGGNLFLYKASDGSWYISDILTSKSGFLCNDTSEESDILPRTDWQYVGDDDEWKDAKLKIFDNKEFTFCKVISISSTKNPNKEFLGEFQKVSHVFRNGWQVYKNKQGKYLFASKRGYWCVRNKMDKDSPDNSKRIKKSKVTGCPAHDQSWKYRDPRKIWRIDESVKITCDVHK